MGCCEVVKEAKITPACPKLLEIGLDWPKTNLLPTDICNLFNKKFEIAELAVFIIISELFYPQIAIIVTNLKHNS